MDRGPLGPGDDSVANAEDEMKLFVNSPGAELRVVDGGRHFLSASDPGQVNRRRPSSW
jgi:hypothetical protein